jgi:predicted phage baseplate assembly protein
VEGRLNILGLAIPDLDNRTFTELMEEGRALIARYSQNQWTDHNVHDPGITFIELFAWLIEMQIYQLNRVTDANYLKFLKLAGYHPQDIQPAEVDITFNNLKTEKEIKAGITQLIAHKDTDRIVFETREDFQLIPAELRSVITTYDSIHVDNTAAN